MKTKMFIITHKEYVETNSKGWSNLFVGQSKATRDDCYYDFTEDNISSLNSLYNELTGIYWVYKHLADFKEFDNIGFCHYSRLFADYDKPIMVSKNYPEGIFEQDFDISNKEIVAPYPVYVSSVEEQYAKAHNKDDIDLIKQIIKETQDKMDDDVDAYFAGRESYLYNMFVMPKEVFIKYCEFIFPVISNYLSSVIKHASRLYISERLTGFFIFYLSRHGYSLRKQPICLIRQKKIKSAVKTSIERFKLKEDKSLVYKLKPLWLIALPRKTEEKLRNKQRKK